MVILQEIAQDPQEEILPVIIHTEMTEAQEEEDLQDQDPQEIEVQEDHQEAQEDHQEKDPDLQEIEVQEDLQEILQEPEMTIPQKEIIK